MAIAICCLVYLMIDTKTLTISLFLPNLLLTISDKQPLIFFVLQILELKNII